MTAAPRPTARAIAAAVNSGQTTALAVAEATLLRLAAYDAVQPQIWISRASPEALLAAARAIDVRLAAGEDLPLAGVPFAVKDNIDVAGFHTTAACPAFAYRPATSATVVERLLAAGALCVGKTNLDQFATGLNGTRSPYGAPRNAHNLAYVSGGSSSGSASAVAAGLVAFALGTDTAGSGRVPAAFQHLVGFKPSKGRWSNRGLVPACRTLDCITVFAHDTADARIVDGIVAGFDPADAFSKPLADRPRKMRAIGVPRRDQRAFFGDVEAEHLYDRALDRLSTLGRIVEIDYAPLQEAAQLLYGGPWVAERTAALAGLLADNPDALDPTVREVVAPGQDIGAVDLFNGIYRLAELKRHADTLWESIDLLAFPTTGTTYRVAELLAAPIALNSALGYYTNFVNLLDMAALAVPAGSRANATGFGVTLIGPADTDLALLDAAEAYLSVADLPPPPPLDLEGKMQTVKLAVVGAHLKDMPLHWQLTSRDAKFVGAFETAPNYRLYAMADSVPPKPALIHSEDGGAIAIEVYELGVAEFGSFVAEVPPPLAIGTVTLADGSSVKGFVAEPRALVGARDITHLGGWRAFVAAGA
ncbi:Amidase [Novosphingobium aromaticivorans DSM 12444]|uniref:Amidase n=1 Tax=Novosphingobium aromaticivorans (strain ATCC 700278 / DSM 12444 / CCUG 56034 / CIP 105152 / NBRC 16084 / F199) TaxID=279238 RepID=Q2GAS1_NOVAD|nr:allophanate hydrolase [Novosphingobium aromaticivorans]ABD25052.1 Amidase [Novosphingobium aromaticivorans DSM 12444]SCY87298.1 allophanate hydrolase [Novosphingobium aromaticivorans]